MGIDLGLATHATVFSTARCVKFKSVVNPRSVLGSDVLVFCDHMSENGITFDG